MEAKRLGFAPENMKCGLSRVSRSAWFRGCEYRRSNGNSASRRQSKTHTAWVVAIGWLVLGAADTAYPQAPQIGFAYVSATDVQTGGPTHRFRVASFEVRNDQFVEFLNDALAHPDDSRGAYLYFETTSGDVYVNTSEFGGSGPTPGGRTIKIFAPTVAGQIVFQDGAFQIVDDDVDFSDHPVSGVSWFGAVKFCNWMTLTSGLPAAQRAYVEGPAGSPQSWRPVTISASAWATRDLNTAERQALIALLGYRLPMDGGATAPGPFNEWQKFASARINSGVIAFDADYGFGRSQLTTADANYLASNDPFEQGTTPVGFFDGASVLGDGSSMTTDTDNAYGLYDVAGNVWEWVQDQSTTDPLQQRNRGGSFRSAPASLRNDVGASRSTGSTVDSTGFRVVQSVLSDILVVPLDGLSLVGPWGGPYGEDAVTVINYRVENVVDRMIDVNVSVDVPWLSITPSGGTVEPGTLLTIETALDFDCGTPLSVGTHDAAIRFREFGGNVLATRFAQLVVTEPLQLTPGDTYTVTRAFGDNTPAPTKTYVLTNHSASDVSWSVTWEETSTPATGLEWLKVDGLDSLGGVLATDQTHSLDVSLDPGESSSLPAGVHTARLTVVDDCTGTSFTRTAKVTVIAPFSVSPTHVVMTAGVVGGPFLPSSHSYTLTNVLTTQLEWTVKVCEESTDPANCTTPGVPWLTLTPSAGEVPATGTAMMAASINSSAWALPAGEHRSKIRFSQPMTGYYIDRTVMLTVTGLDVRPATGVFLSGSLGGPFTPATTTYTVHNNGVKEFAWSTTLTYNEPGVPEIEWLEVYPDFGVILDPLGSQQAVVRPTDAAATLPAGIYEATVTFVAGNVEASRQVMLTVGTEGFRITTVLIPGNDVQTAGPTHDFRIGRYEVTNDEFARFLNHALRHGDEAAGGWLYHDLDSSSVYIHDAIVSLSGSDAPNTRWTVKLYDGAVGRIHYDPTGSQPYVVETGFGNHPVSGVSWFGAAKFCNWLTLTQGMSETSRAYSEGPAADEWRAATAELDTLLALPGYRLPMDGGSAGANTTNEWYKAAARRGVDHNDVPLFGALFGFGRSTLTAADANFAANGDTEIDRTTPVGFFNGTNQLFAGGPTAGTQNGYDLYDLTGNVAEWVHDVVGSGVPTGATRGGHFSYSSTATQLRTNVRQPRTADATFAFLGFRIAQSITPVALDLHIDDDAFTSNGPVGGPYDRDSFALPLRNDADYTADDFNITIGSPWVTFDGVVPRLIPPHETIDAVLRLSASADALNVGTFVNQVRVRDDITDSETSTAVTLTLSEPLSIDGEEKTPWTFRYCAGPEELTATFTMTNASAMEMPWRVTKDVSWLTITPSEGDTLTGNIGGLIDDAPATITFEVAPNEHVEGLSIGERDGVVTFLNTRTNKSTRRTISLKIAPPIAVEPSDASARTVTIPWNYQISELESINATLIRCATCDAGCALEYAVVPVEDWLTVEPVEHLLGIVPPPGESVPLTIRVNHDAAGFGPGKHVGHIDFNVFDVVADSFAGKLTYEVTLEVLDPIEIDVGAPSWDVGCALDPDDPPSRAITLTNRHESSEIGVELGVDVPWIDVDAIVHVLPGETESAGLTLNDMASSMFGTQEVTLSVTDTLSEHVHTIILAVNLTGTFCVTPLAGFDAYGPVGGTIVPAFRLFEASYAPEEEGTIDWRARSDQPWLTIDGGSSVNGILEAGDSYVATALIDDALLPSPPNEVDERMIEATLTFENLTDGITTTRRIRLYQTRPPFAADMRLVPATAAEPGGPAYSFLMGRTHVTNRQFVEFLNDAMAHPNDPRGHFVFFDMTTGDVFLNSAAPGGRGPDPGSRTILLYAPGEGGAIELIGGEYSVVPGSIDYSDHPVVGVSWYGAVKFCNWLTIAQGLGAQRRCYGEGTSDEVVAWHPLGISEPNWSLRDLNDTERQVLVSSCQGFRLPMDDGYTNTDPQADAPDAYNEWYKAGAWDDTVHRHRLYGFGRDSINPADANFRCSGDPFEDAADCTVGGTTPIGFFDGTVQTAGNVNFATNASTNPFGLMDMTGNAYQWMQGRYAPSATIDRRGLRGGGWNDAVGSDALRMTRRILWASPTTTNAQVGFRVVRVPFTPSFDMDGDGVINTIDALYVRICQNGPNGHVRGGCARADGDGDGDVDLRDLAAFYVNFTP